MYKANHLLLPTHFCNMFVRNSAIHRHNTRQSDKFHMVAVNSAKKLNTIKHFGPRYWNNLPLDIKFAATHNSFTKKMKSHLISAYVWCLCNVCCVYLMYDCPFLAARNTHNTNKQKMLDSLYFLQIVSLPADMRIWCYVSACK